VWSAHFDTDGDVLVAITVDGAYTAQAYDINSPPKVALRHARGQAIDESLHVLATVPALLAEVMTTIDFQPSREQRIRLEVAERLHKTVAAARRTLIQLSAIPHDADAACACDANACELPPIVAATLVHVELEPGTQ
jgi:hypothetical protein